MNNKGFTLIELLAVIVILLGLAGITVFGITNVLDKEEENKLNQQRQSACGAAKIYFSLKDSNQFGCVKGQTLIDEGYFTSTSDTSEIENMKITVNKDKVACVDGLKCNDLTSVCSYSTTPYICS